ncbi:hypothetical protein XENTR_v10011378 [Xenopus tropicalis]|nr:hypothetical protein XENTR_v10011378 [Xenopus tropicalis]
MGVSVLSWNVRGLNDSIKRRLVMDYIRKQNAKITFLQETHLTGSKLITLQKQWVGWSYHSTFSTYTGGTSILVRKSTVFQPLSIKTDPRGRYVFVYCLLNATPVVLANIYIPPHTRTSVSKNWLPL